MAAINVSRTARVQQMLQRLTVCTVRAAPVASEAVEPAGRASSWPIFAVNTEKREPLFPADTACWGALGRQAPPTAACIEGQAIRS